MRSLFEVPIIAAAEEALLLARRDLRTFWASTLVGLPDLGGVGLSDWRVGQTDVDLHCDEIIRNALAKVLPEVEIVSEESIPRTSRPTGFCFLIDPVDATHNASAGYPAFTSCVALYDGDRYIFGWVYDIGRDVIYSAASKQGAYLQSSIMLKRLRVKADAPLERMAVSVLRTRVLTGRMTRIISESGKLRISSCSSLDMCLIAAGTLDAFVDLNEPGHERTCDIAAASVILQEAGGNIFTTMGSQRQLLPPGLEAVHDYQSLIAAPSLVGASNFIL